jgi:hypothetical protein
MEFEVKIVEVRNEVGKLEASRTLFYYRMGKFESGLKMAI